MAFRVPVPPLFLAGAGLFWIGLFFRANAWPMASLMCAAGPALLVLALPFRPHATDGWLHLALRATVAAGHAALLFRLFFWPYQAVVYTVLAVVVLATLVLLVRSRSNGTLSTWPALLTATLALASAMVPAHRISHAFGVGSPFRQDLRRYDHHAWMQYAWFLEQDGDREEAIAALDRARSAAERCVHAIGATDALVRHYDTLRHRLEAGTWSALEWTDPRLLEPASPLNRGAE
jgi:hypothetical protein